MWRFVKWPNLGAIGCFFLPWLTVSCSSQRLVTASGWDLVAGHISVTDPLTGITRDQIVEHQWWLALALFLTMAGAIVAFSRRDRPGTLLATSLGSFAAILLTTSRLTVRALANAAAREHGDWNQAAAGLIRLDWQSGYWATLGLLLIAAMLSGLTWSGRVVRLSRMR